MSLRISSTKDKEPKGEKIKEFLCIKHRRGRYHKIKVYLDLDKITVQGGHLPNDD